MAVDRSSRRGRPAAAQDEIDVLDTPQAGPRAIRGAGLRGASYVAGGLLGLVSAPLLTRHLGLADFGRYQTVVALLALVAGVTEAGLGPVGMRQYAQLSGAERDRFMANMLGMRLALTTAGGMGAVLFALVVGYRRDLVAGTAVGAVGLLIEVTYATLAVSLYARLQIGRQVAAELLKQIVSVALIVVLVVAGARIVPLLAVSTPSGLLLLGLTAWFAHRVTPLHPRFDAAAWREVLAETLPVGAAVAASALYFRSVILVMSLVAAAVETGYFSLSYRIIEVLIGIPVLLVATTFPILARAAVTDDARLDYAARRIFEVAGIGGCWLALCTVAGAPLAIDLLGGPAAEPAVEVLRIQAFTLLAAFFSGAAGFVLLALREHRTLLLANGVALAFTLTLALLLVRSDGARGGAIATALGESLLAVVLVAALRRRRAGLRVSPPALLRVVPAAVAALGVLAVPGLEPTIRVIVVSVVYVGGLVLARAIPPELRAALPALRNTER